MGLTALCNIGKNPEISADYKFAGDLEGDKLPTLIYYDKGDPFSQGYKFGACIDPLALLYSSGTDDEITVIPTWMKDDVDNYDDAWKCNNLFNLEDNAVITDSLKKYWNERGSDACENSGLVT